ncbi:hypothetical protein D3C78_1954120 [compost metagenome]
MPATGARVRWPGGPYPLPGIEHQIRLIAVCWLNGLYAWVHLPYGQAGAMDTPDEENLPEIPL